jgi:hypothetical protein
VYALSVPGDASDLMMSDSILLMVDSIASTVESVTLASPCFDESFTDFAFGDLQSCWRKDTILPRLPEWLI